MAAYILVFLFITSCSQPLTTREKGTLTGVGLGAATEVVATGLKDHGVSAQRITSKGFGERYPVAPNTTADGADNPSGRAKNRRVEVVIENQ